ncbi:MAG: hypothetical protein RR651_11785 [Lysinibacillus sp.]
MEVNQVQIFEKGYNNRCSTFACGNRAVRYIGRPDAPLNLSYVLCEKCLNELVQSVTKQYIQVPKAPSSVDEIVSYMNADPEYRQSLIDNEELRAWVLHAIDHENNEKKPMGEGDGHLTIPSDLSNGPSVDPPNIIDTSDEDNLTEEMIHGARTHADIDKLIEEYELEDVPTKATGATVIERKDAIFKQLFVESEEG